MSLVIKRFGLFVLATSMLVSCFSHDEDILVGESVNASATKIINSPRSAEEGCLLIKFNDKATLAFEQAECSNDITRSNIEPLNIALTKIGTTNIEPLFTMNPKNQERVREMGLNRWYIVSFNDNEQLEKAANIMATVEDVEVVQYNSIVSHQPTTIHYADEPIPTTRLTVSEVNDPEFARQWHYYNTGEGVHEKQVAGMDVNVKDAWRYCTGDPSIVVAVIDEGVDYTHEDLNPNMWVNKGEIADNGKDDDGNGFVDDVYGFNHYTGGQISWKESGDNGHGTHVAGTIAAVNNNGIGVCGIAGGDGSGNGVRIMSSQMFSGKSKGSAAVSAKAFQYAADNGAVIAQCSWGYDAGVFVSDESFLSATRAEYDGILYFQGAKNSEVLDGGLVIFSAGNEGKGFSGYPSGYRDFISVASIGCDGMPAPYSNYGPGVNICAPGGNSLLGGKKGEVYSTMPNNRYGYMEGTSMACPHVSGIAALGLSYAKKLGKKFTLEEFTAMLLLSVNDINADLKALPLYNAGSMGSGRIDALRMLMNVEGTPCINITRGKTEEINLGDIVNIGEMNVKVRDAISISDADKNTLGVSMAQILDGVLYIQCDKVGHGIVNVELMVGETSNDEKMGGRVTTKKIALIVRDSHTANGGWL